MVAIESSKLFSRLPATALRLLRAAANEKSLGDGELIFKEGDPGDGLYMVKSGTVEISVEVQNGARQVLSALPPGEIFGEMAVVDEQPRSACASARGDTSVYFVPRGPFQELIRQFPEAAILMMQEISGRLREFNRHYLREVLQAERMAVVGRFASAIVVLERVRAPLTVPEDAIVRMGTGTAVFRADSSGFELQPVTVGRSDGSTTEIVSGLERGARVVTKNAFLLKAELEKEAGGDED